MKALLVDLVVRRDADVRVEGGLEGMLCSRRSFVGQQGFSSSDGNRIFRLQLPDSQRFQHASQKKRKTQTTHTHKNTHWGMSLEVGPLG